MMRQCWKGRASGEPMAKAASLDNGLRCRNGRVPLDAGEVVLRSGNIALLRNGAGVRAWASVVRRVVA